MAGFLSVGAASKRMTVFSSDIQDYDNLFGECVSIHVNSLSGSVGTMKLGGLFGFRTRRCVSYGENPRMLIEDLEGLKKNRIRGIIFGLITFFIPMAIGYVVGEWVLHLPWQASLLISCIISSHTLTL